MRAALCVFALLFALPMTGCRILSFSVGCATDADCPEDSTCAVDTCVPSSGDGDIGDGDGDGDGDIGDGDGDTGDGDGDGDGDTGDGDGDGDGDTGDGDGDGDGDVCDDRCQDGETACSEDQLAVLVCDLNADGCLELTVDETCSAAGLCQINARNNQG